MRVQLVAGLLLFRGLIRRLDFALFSLYAFFYYTGIAAYVARLITVKKKLWPLEHNSSNNNHQCIRTRHGTSITHVTSGSVQLWSDDAPYPSCCMLQSVHTLLYALIVPI